MDPLVPWSRQSPRPPTLLSGDIALFGCSEAGLNVHVKVKPRDLPCLCIAWTQLNLLRDPRGGGLGQPDPRPEVPGCVPRGREDGWQ